MLGWIYNPVAVEILTDPVNVSQDAPWQVELLTDPVNVEIVTDPVNVAQTTPWQVEILTDPVNVQQTLDLSTDTLPNWGFQPAFGQRFNVATGTTADVWSGTALVRPLPLVPTLMSIVSTSASDAAASVLGAQYVQITWIDSAGDWRTSDLLPLNGLTPVPITYKPGDPLVTQGVLPSPPDGTSIAAPIFRIQDVAVILAGGSTVAAPRVTNIGTLRIRDTATATITFENVPIGYGRSSSAAFHCPRNFEARLTRVHVGTARGSGRVDINSTFGIGTAWQRVPLVPLNDAAVVFLNDAATTPIESRADLQASITAGSNNIDVSCILQIRLKPL